MSRFLWIAAVAAATLLVAWLLWPERTVTNYPSNGTTIVAFGDSLIEGVGSTPGNDLTSILSREIGRPVVNLGRAGDTTREAMERLPTVLSRDPKVVILLIGGNDYLRRVPREQTQANIASMIQQIHNQGAIVLLLGVRGGVLSDNFRAMYDELADTYETAYVSDVLHGIIAHPELLSDSVHPNDAGYQKIAGRVAPVLKRLIR